MDETPVQTMFSVYTQKKCKAKNHRLEEQCYAELNKDVGTLIDLGVSQQVVVDTINGLDCMNQDLDDSCAAAAAAHTTFDDDDMVKK